jgi:hypothetical protein
VPYVQPVSCAGYSSCHSRHLGRCWRCHGVSNLFISLSMVLIAGGVSPVSSRGCAPMRSAGDVYSSVVTDQLVVKSNQKPTKGLTRGGDLREAQLDVPSTV